MAKICAFCSQAVVWPNIFTCVYCQKTYCPLHRIAENHNCPKVIAAKSIEKEYLRRKGVNITTGKYAVACKKCGYRTEYFDIEAANLRRIAHIKVKGCPSSLVQLRQHEEDRAEDAKLEEQSRAKDPTDWMDVCLQQAKDIIRKHHVNYDVKSFFENAIYELYIQNDKPNAYAYVNIIEGSSRFAIGIHPVLSEEKPTNKRVLTIVLVHELLHSIHNDEGWEEGRILYEERLLANKAGHYDALVELQNLALSGKMRFCDS